MSPRMCKSSNRLDGKTAIITGANTGIGKETAKDLFSRGARVIIGCRDLIKAAEAAEYIKKADESRPDAFVVKHLDLASIKSIRKFAEEILQSETSIDILINNAGVMFCPQSKTEDGFEMQFGVNHLGHFLLTHLLLDKIKASAPSRIVTVSSLGHKNGKMHFDDLHLEKNYSAMQGYFQSKLANLLFAKELARRLEGTGVTSYVLHPGIVETEIGRHIRDTNPGMLGWLMETAGRILNVTAVEGAQTSIYCAVADETKDQSGLYYSDCKVASPSCRANNDADAKKLWDMSCDLLGIENSKIS